MKTEKTIDEPNYLQSTSIMVPEKVDNKDISTRKKKKRAVKVSNCRMIPRNSALGRGKKKINNKLIDQNKKIVNKNSKYESRSKRKRHCVLKGTSLGNGTVEKVFENEEQFSPGVVYVSTSIGFHQYKGLLFDTSLYGGEEGDGTTLEQLVRSHLSRLDSLGDEGWPIKPIKVTNLLPSNNLKSPNNLIDQHSTLKYSVGIESGRLYHKLRQKMNSMKKENKPHIIIIGAGLAGYHAHVNCFL